MKDVVSRVLEHPIASWFIVSATLSGIADIVRAVRGVERKPIVITSPSATVSNTEES